MLYLWPDRHDAAGSQPPGGPPGSRMWFDTAGPAAHHRVRPQVGSLAETLSLLDAASHGRWVLRVLLRAARQSGFKFRLVGRPKKNVGRSTALPGWPWWSRKPQQLEQFSAPAAGSGPRLARARLMQVPGHGCASVPVLKPAFFNIFYILTELCFFSQLHSSISQSNLKCVDIC